MSGKRLLSIILILFLSACACAETLSPITPTPSPTPAGTEFSCEAFLVYLPEDMEILNREDLAGYEAAVQHAFPNAAEIQLAAINPARGAALCFSIFPSEQTPLQAAREAAESILGSADNAQEFSFGSNNCAGFACSLSETNFRFYYFSSGSHLLLVSVSGLSDGEISAMLSTLYF